METFKEKVKASKALIRGELGISNDFAVPRLLKVVVSSGTGSLKDDRKRTLVFDRISRITGQHAAVRGAKKSIASFKVRQGDPVGVIVTLRGVKMYAFLDKLITIALPRMRDFRGLDPKCVNTSGDMTIGIKEHTIFPETADEALKDVFGLAITIVSTAQTKHEAFTLYRAIGLPFRREDREEGKKRPH